MEGAATCWQQEWEHHQAVGETPFSKASDLCLMKPSKKEGYWHLEERIDTEVEVGGEDGGGERKRVHLCGMVSCGVALYYSVVACV